MSQETQWYISQEGQQLGPYTGEQLLSFAQGGNITRESMVWAEGMAEWLPAERIDGLFPVAAAAGPVRSAPATARPGPARAGATQPGGPARAGTATVARPTQAPAGRATGQPTAHGQVTQGPEGRATFPRPPVPVASFGMFAGSMALGVVFLAAALFILFKAAEQVQPDPAMVIIMISCFGVSGLCFLLGQIFGMINLYRAWFCLSRAGATVSPGLAVGLLFVPFFNFYWLFRAYFGFAREWNFLTQYYEDTRRAPRMSEGLFLAFCIVILIFPVVGFILIFPVMSSMCKAINFIAHRPLHARGPVRSR